VALGVDAFVVGQDLCPAINIGATTVKWGHSESLALLGDHVRLPRAPVDPAKLRALTGGEDRRILEHSGFPTVSFRPPRGVRSTSRRQTTPGRRPTGPCTNSPIVYMPTTPRSHVTNRMTALRCTLRVVHLGSANLAHDTVIMCSWAKLRCSLLDTRQAASARLSLAKSPIATMSEPGPRRLCLPETHHLCGIVPSQRSRVAVVYPSSRLIAPPSFG
jgi:hypothetical protein